MANPSEFVGNLGAVKPDATLPSRYVGVLNLVIQAFCLFVVLGSAFIHPTALSVAVSAVVCLGLAAVGYHNLRRTFFYTRMPLRWKEDDPRVQRVRSFQALLILCLVAICAGSLYFLFFGGLHSWRHQWQWFYPVVVLFNGCSDYIQDRLPLRPPRKPGGGAKIWSSMKPIRSDHWGENDAP